MTQSKGSRSVSRSLSRCPRACGQYGFRLVSLALKVEYTDEYPDVLPIFFLEVQQGELEDDEINQLLVELGKVVRTCPSPSSSSTFSFWWTIRAKRI